MSRVTYDPEKFQLDIALYKVGGDVFEIVVDPDAALAFREGKANDINQVLKYSHIFSDAQRGLHAPTNRFEELFKTTEESKIATIILTKGEIHFTSEYKNQLREQKKKQILATIARNGVDPRTNLPHPLARIESSFAEANVKIDEFKPAADQVQTVLKQLMPILPIRFEEKEIKITIPKEYASKLQKLLKTYGDVKKGDWLPDGSYLGIIMLPGGLEEEFYSKMNSLTHGTIRTEVLSIK